MNTNSVLFDLVLKAEDALADLAAMADLAVLDHDALGLQANARNLAHVETALRIARAAVEDAAEPEGSK